MNKLLCVFSLFLLTSGLVNADAIYVDDEQNLTLRTSPSQHAKGLKVLAVGDQLTIIDNQSKFDFINI